MVAPMRGSGRGPAGSKVDARGRAVLPNASCAGWGHGSIAIVPLGPVVMIRDMNYELFMGEALAVARQAAERGAPPVGAIAVMNEAMVARGANRVAEKNDPTAHAVIAALREASRKLGTTHLTDVTIFTTHEPCPMCVGALLESDVAALVFAVPNPVDGAAGSVLQLAQHPGLARRLQVVSGIRAEEAAELTADRAAVAAGA
jgi:tRNA(adenine34) deaminase